MEGRVSVRQARQGNKPNRAEEVQLKLGNPISGRFLTRFPYTGYTDTQGYWI